MTFVSKLIPPRRLYVALLIEEARRTQIPIERLLHKRARLGAAQARHRVWAKLYATGKYSTTGIAKVAGCDHTVVARVMRANRLSGGEIC